MVCISTKYGRFALTEFGVLDSSLYSGHEEGSIEFFQDAHKVFHRWLKSEQTQEEYFFAPYFVMTPREEESVRFAWLEDDSSIAFRSEN